MFKKTLRSPFVLAAMAGLLIGLNGKIDLATLMIVGLVALGLVLTFATVSKLRERDSQPPSFNH